MSALTLISSSRTHRPALRGPQSENAPRSSSYLFTLIHRYQHPAFQLAHGILRDEVAAEKIIQQVFSRVRRRLDRGADHVSAVLWIHYASLRFACRYYWKSATPYMRRRLEETGRSQPGDFALSDFVRVLAFQPEKIGPHDCELIVLRHVLGLSLTQIGQVLRMHPYEISNRLTWSLERLKTKNPHVAPLPAHEELTHAASA